MRSRTSTVGIWTFIVVLLIGSAAWPQSIGKLKTGKKQGEAKTAENLPLTRPLNSENIDQIVAGLTDTQVRRLLIDELKSQAQKEARGTAGQVEVSNSAGFVAKVKDLTALMQDRIEFLRSGGTRVQKIGGIYTLLGTGEHGTKSVIGVILSIAAVLAGALVFEGLFVLYTATLRRRIVSTTPSGWTAKIGALSLRSLLDLTSILIFIIAAVVTFFIFLDRTAGQRVLLAAYLSALVFVQCGYLVLRFFLSPRAPALRFLPFSDSTALYLYRWLLALIVVICFGRVTADVMLMAGATELATIKVGTLVTLTAAGMLIWMILQKRKETALAFSRGLPEMGLRYRLIQKWHHFAVFAVLLLLVAAVINIILGTTSGQGILTLLMIPLYFLLDWILRLVLEAAFGIVEKPLAQSLSAAKESDRSEENGETDISAPQASGAPPADKSAREKGLDLEKMKSPLRSALRLSLAMLLFFWTLKIWKIALPVGEAMAGAIMQILIVVLLCYVAWSLINAAIIRRMRREAPEGSDNEGEEGGAGGSRIGTLLLLLRKFMLVVILVMAGLIILSALGVNIGPLIAGAGVFGLAIGFGAQTLVKDIISGIFFLMDDAFRVGDYVECSGTKGSVEHISLRSLRLRSPRGMVNFIPFGDIKMVTNLSRDYVIMKLDFRVRYDVDVEKIRKIIKKKVYGVIQADPELGPKLLEPIKSQGVREMDDSAMVMRVKYKTRPGDQFAIRREVYRLMQEAFKEAGIEFAHRNVTVYMPPETGNQTQEGGKSDSGDKLQAAAAAALSAVDEEALQPEKPKKK